jgi:hypothetical protein
MRGSLPVSLKIVPTYFSLNSVQLALPSQHYLVNNIMLLKVFCFFLEIDVKKAGGEGDLDNLRDSFIIEHSNHCL